jgi:outer membrane protease
LIFEYLLGVKYIRYEWEVNGGRYSYGSGARVGRFPNDLKVMTYSQQLTIPYLGLQANWLCSQRWNFKLFGKYSPLGYALCHDNHLLRSTTFTSEHWCSQYWILGIEAAWHYSDQIRTYLKYSYDQLNLSKGNIKMHEEDERSFYRNAAGVGGNLQMVTLGVSARF